MKGRLVAAEIRITLCLPKLGMWGYLTPLGLIIIDV